ncbi:unnamed protein product [Trichobilharzia regenti]|nr:unnamed protein product [Trichobilharzia regenti]
MSVIHSSQLICRRIVTTFCLIGLISGFTCLSVGNQALSSPRQSSSSSSLSPSQSLMIALLNHTKEWSSLKLNDDIYSRNHEIVKRQDIMSQLQKRATSDLVPLFAPSFQLFQLLSRVKKSSV